ncbi:MAG: hypothetical protein QOJ76_790, partial [Acidobacteriota bacterium]|nr:hypothetical protein [Acidobacteriota bacterium]
NVGVGTTAPDTKLNIVGSNLSASFPVMASFYDTALPAIDTGAGVLLGGAYNTNGGFAGFGAIKGLKANAANGDLTGGVGFYTRGGPGSMSERMRIDSSGNIGIGTASPAAKLHVGAGNILLDNTYYLAAKDPSGTVRDILYGRWSNDTTILRGGTGGLIFDVNNMPTNSLVIDGNGHLGVNHYTHNQVQQWLGTSGANVFGQIISLSAGQTLPAIEVRNSSDAAIANINASGGAYFAGKIGIGTAAPATALHVVGDVTVTGNINAKYQDVAEWVPTTERLAAGTVVIVDAKGANRVLASAAAYDTSVAGVVSAQPGLTLGEAGEGKALVATTGRVKVKVDATRAPIRAGDLLVTSDVAGVAMKSEPVLFGGVAMHRPGTIIGKALESLDKGTGEILVLLSLQ